MVAKKVTDPEGGQITPTGSTVSTNGITLLNSSGYLLYQNTNAVNDQFNYIVNDVFGGSATGLVTVVVAPFVTGQQTGSISVIGNTATISFHGIPNYTYVAQRSTNMLNWVDVSTNT